MENFWAERFLWVTNHLSRYLEFVILKLILQEKALSVKEIAEASHYSVREIQTALRSLVDKQIIIRTELPGVRFPVYYLNQSVTRYLF